MKFLIFSLFAVSICCTLFAKNYSTKIYLCSSSVDEFQKEINSTSQDIVDRLKGDVVCSFDISDNQKVKFSKKSFLQKHKEGKKLSETNSIELSKDLPEFGIELSAYCRNLKGSGEIAIELDFLYSELIGFIEFDTPTKTILPALNTAKFNSIIFLVPSKPQILNCYYSETEKNAKLMKFFVIIVE